MASNPWAILGAARQGQSIGDLYIGAKQRRLSELYRAKQEARLDRKDQREQEEIDSYGGLFEPATPRPSAHVRVGVIPTTRLSDLAGVGSTPVQPSGGAAATLPPSGEASPAPVNGGAVGDEDIVVTGRKIEEPQTPPDKLFLNVEGLRRLGRSNPKLALQLSKMDTDQQIAAYKAIREQTTVESQIIGAVRRAPEEDRPHIYAQIRAEYEGKGVKGLPPAWDEDLAETHQAAGLTAMQAFNAERADKRLAADIEDDQADNERADRDTESRIEDRDARRGLTARGQNIASADRRRGQDMSGSRPRSGTASAPVIHNVKTPAEALKLPKGAYFKTPDGQIKVRP